MRNRATAAAGRETCGRENEAVNRQNTVAGIKSLVITVSALFLFIVAVLLDLQYLYLMAAALAVLPLTSYGLASFFATRFSVQRHHPSTVPEGRRCPITLTVRSEGGLPQATLRIADALPPELEPVSGADEARPLTTWDGSEGSRTYVVEPTVRGVFALGPARIETTDPLGLFTFGATLNVQSELVVHPEPMPARDSAVGGEGTHGVRERDGKTRRGAGMDFHGVREYRPGDPLRRVHWPTTARTGELAVVEFERAYQQDIVIGLDLAKGANYGEGRETTLEYAVKVAATLADRTLRAGGGVALITQSERVVVRPREGDPEALRFRLFDLLARARADAETSLTEALLAARVGQDGTHYAILTACGDPRLIAYLTERISRGDTACVYFFEPSSFGGPHVMSPAVAGADLRVVQREHSPWAEGGKALEHLLRED